MLVEEKEQKQKRREKRYRGVKAYSNVMMVRIRKDKQGEPEGEIIHLNLQNPVSFQGMNELEFRIDEIARFLNLPESSRKHASPRMDQKGDSQTFQKELWQTVPTEQWKRTDFICYFPAKKAQEIVCLELLGRQYRSLQGRLRCRYTGEQYVYFRSGLELIHFFAELLQEME